MHINNFPIPIATTNSRASRGTGSKNPNHYSPNTPLFNIQSASLSDFVKSPLTTHYPRELIKKRISYQFWRNITESIKFLSHKKRVGVVYNMWLQMDGRHQFNTCKQAGFELESAVLSLIELKEEQDGTK
jgi:hypothetical protein